MSPPARLRYLDGIRGAAALYVFINHSLYIAAPSGADTSLSPPMQFLREVFSQGHFAVCIFIVLSGFSLMLPLARHDALRLQGGFGPYMRRRIRRIMPPYYAALVVSIVGILAVSASATTQVGRDEYDTALSPGSIVSHGLLVHNLDFDWAFRINGPMWSVATEWQIYFLFPLILLPMWRRFGGIATIVVLWVAAMMLNSLVPSTNNLFWAAPWFIGSFALGMGAAQLVARPRGRNLSLHHVPWGSLACALFVGIALIVGTDAARTWPLPLSDLVVSAFAFALIMSCATGRTGLATAARRAFSWHGLVWLGAISYSLYLLQHPLLRLSEKVLGKLSTDFEQVLWLQLVIGTPILVAVSLAFAKVFELPFTSGRHLPAWFRLRGLSRSRRTASAAPVVH